MPTEGTENGQIIYEITLIVTDNINVTHRGVNWPERTGTAFKLSFLLPESRS